MKRRKNNGFSLIELIVVIAILAVMVVVLAPKLLSYTERSRANKDDSSMDEVVNAIQLALADQEIYDEVVQFSTADNISCYIDSSSEADYQKMITKSNPNGVDQYTFTSESRTKDETPFYAAGNMRGVTITFAPFKDSNVSKFDLKQGVINQYVQVKNNQRFGAIQKLYGRVRSATGDVVNSNSQTYRNSEYTIFIRIGTTGGNDAAKQDAVKVYGQWSGTNLPLNVSYKIVSDRTTGDDGATIVVDDNGWNTENGSKITVNPGDLNGGGSFNPSGSGSSEPEDKQLTADDFADDEKDIYAYLVNGDTLVLRNKPREDVSDVTKTYGKLGYYHDRNWNTDASKIKTVNIETPILPKSCNGWFNNFQMLTEVKNIENIITDICKDMYMMFYQCTSLTSVGDLSDWNTSSVTNMNSMFYECYDLTSIGDLSGWNTGNITNMSGMFYNCQNLTSIGDLSDWNTGNVKNMQNMFNRCTSLTSIGDLSGWNTGNITNMGGMFCGCNNLTSVGDLSGWNTGNVTVMNSMFYNCRSLPSIDLSGWDTGNVTNMNAMFYSCYALTSVGDLNGWNTGKVTNMGSMFWGCNNLTSVGDLSGWNTGNVTVMNSMFCHCRNLTSVGDLIGWNTGKVTNMGDMFYNCYALTSVGDLNGWDISSLTYKSSMFYNCPAPRPSWY